MLHGDWVVVMLNDQKPQLSEQAMAMFLRHELNDGVPWTVAMADVIEQGGYDDHFLS